MEVEPLPPWPSIGQMFADNAARFGDAPAIVDGEIELNYAELLKMAGTAAKALLAAGIGRGDLVAFWAPNSWRWAVMAHAAWMVGGVVVPISSRLKVLEAGPILERTEAKILFTVAECAGARFIDSLHETYGAELIGLPALKHVVQLDLAGSFDAFLDSGRSIDETAVARATNEVDGEDVCEIVFTSGTTGAPKGVQLSHYQLMRSYWTWSGIGALRFGDKYLVITPFSHGFGLNAGIIASALRGMCMVVLDFFEPERTLGLIRRHGINVMGGPPNLFARLMDLAEVAANPPTSLRVAFLGAASVPMEILKRCRSVLGIERVINAYGLMEASVVSMTRADDPPDVIAGTTGRALEAVEVKVADDAGAELPPAMPGEILVRSYGVMKGYWRDPAQTAASMTPDGWFHTGDIGTIDAAGNITIVDRKKDMFICGGFNAYPAEIENLLLRIDGLSAVSVVAVPDELRGEVPVAFVVPAADSGVGPDTVLSWAKRNIASYKVPRQVHVVSALPLNANGKVMKDVLRERAIGVEGKNGIMKFSTFHLFHQHDGWSEREVYDYNVRIVEYLEEMGFDGVWLAEHHFRDYGLCNSIPGLLSFLAARTSRIRLGTGIIVLPLHNPINVAEEIAQLDMLSGGRVDFGVGRGYQSGEFTRFGIDLSEARDRFDEALDLILRLWREDAVTHEGKFYRCSDVTLKPKPLQRPRPPTYIASISPDTVKRCAQKGLPILGDPVATFRNLGRAAETWRTEMAEAGFTTDGIDLTCMRTVYVAETNDKAREDMARFETGFDRGRIINIESAPIDPKTGAIAKGYEHWEARYMKGGTLPDDFRWEQLEVIGDPARVIGQIKTLEALGYSNVMCDFGSTRPMPIEEMKKIIRLFAEEVMPEFRR